MKIGYLDLYVYSLKIGFKALKRGVFNKESIKRILCPLDPDRFYELPKVGSSLELKPGSKVLDISSPKLLVYFLAEKNPGVTFYSTDIYKAELKNWEKIMGKKTNVISEIQDARKLSYGPNFFDEAFSISVIEHIRDQKIGGDTVMIRNIYKVLKKEGRFIFTTIVAKHKSSVFKRSNNYSNKKNKLRNNFFCRIYTLKEIKSRILDRSKFGIIKKEVCNYRIPFYLTFFNKMMPLSILMGWVNLLLAPFMFELLKEGDKIEKHSIYFVSLVK